MLVITWSSRKSDFGAQRPLERSMPSGYDKSPDYGGPEPSRGRIIFGVIAVAAVPLFVAWPTRWAG